MGFSSVYKNCAVPQKNLNVANKIYVDDKFVLGDLKWSARSTDHIGWVQCNGRALSRSTYAELFEVIGTTYGAGDGTTTFNIPDCRGRVLGGAGSSAGLTARALGTTVGTETHTLTTDQIPSHTHTINDPGHTHTYVNNTNDQSTDNAFSTESAADNADLSKTTGTSTTGITINNAGGGQAFNIMQPTIFAGHVFIYGGLL